MNSLREPLEFNLPPPTKVLRELFLQIHRIAIAASVSADEEASMACRHSIRPTLGKTPYWRRGLRQVARRRHLATVADDNRFVAHP